MARQLHHRKSDDKYAVWSTVIDDYVIGWADKDTVKRQWFLDLIKRDMEQVDRWINHIDEEVDENG